MRRRFEAGEALFRQGDPSDVAIQILSGSVDVLREVGDDAIVLGTVRAGEFVGEMGVLEGRTRSATVRAAGPVEAELIERQAFLDRVSDEPELARKLLVRMSARLRDVEDTLTGLYARDSEDAPRRDLVETPRPAHGAPSLMLRAATERARGVLGADLMPITRLPFTVGRTPADDEAPAFIAARSRDPRTAAVSVVARAFQPGRAGRRGGRARPRQQARHDRQRPAARVGFSERQRAAAPGREHRSSRAAAARRSCSR